MTITIEISNPLQVKPWRATRLVKNRPAYRIGWLWFAIGLYRCREDELLDGSVEFTLNTSM